MFYPSISPTARTPEGQRVNSHNKHVRLYPKWPARFPAYHRGSTSKWLRLCTCLQPSCRRSRRQRAQSLHWKSWLRFSESQRPEFYIYLFLKPWCLAQTNIQKICSNENLFAQKEAVKYQVRIAIWHTNTSKAALIPPIIAKSHCGENGLIVKSRRYFHSVNFLTSGDHSLVLLSLWHLWPPPPLQFSTYLSISPIFRWHLSLPLIFKWLISYMRLSNFFILWPLSGRIPINSNTCIWLLFYLLFILKSTFLGQTNLLSFDIQLPPGYLH